MGKLKLTMSGRKFPRMDLFSKSDPFLCIFMPSQGVFTVAAKTEVKKNNHDPDWDEITIDNPLISPDNTSLRLKFQVRNES